jgi:hypothetical protein
VARDWAEDLRAVAEEMMAAEMAAEARASPPGALVLPLEQNALPSEAQALRVLARAVQVAARDSMAQLWVVPAETAGFPLFPVVAQAASSALLFQRAQFFRVAQACALAFPVYPAAARRFHQVAPVLRVEARAPGEVLSPATARHFHP